MHKYIILFFYGMIFLAACGHKSIPPDVIPEKKMTGLLTDIHITDGSLYAVEQKPDSLYKYGTGRYLTVFNKYHTTGKAFDHSLKYYATRPDVIQKIYEQVAVNLQNKLDSLNKTNPTNTTNAVPAK